MKPEFFCCIGAELKDEIAGSLKSSRIFMYRAAESQTIADMLVDGFFNEADDLRLNDLILLYCPEQTRAITYAKVSSVSGGIIKTSSVSVSPEDIPIDTTGYSNISGSNLQQIINSIDAEFDKYLKLDGSSTMTGVLKMRASVSFECAIAPYWHGVGFYKLNDDDSVSLMASMEATDGFEPGTNNTYNIGSTSKKWKNLYLAGKAYMSVINNGFDIAVPVTNSADTLALKSEVDNAANSGRMITDAGVWFAKMYAASVVPTGAEYDGTNYADFSQVDNDNNPIIVIYEGQSGSWVETERVTPPANYDGYVPVTKKIWDIVEQTGQQGGRVLWNHQSKQFTPYPNIVDLSDVATTDLDNLTDAGKNIGNWSSNVTNCITNIPQDIIAEFDVSTKTLTIKAGSKLYIPNGFEADGTTPHFDTITVATDQTLTNSFTSAYTNILVCWDSANNIFRQTPSCDSGSTDHNTTVGNRLWYDTDTNKIKYYAANNTTVTSDSVSLPVCRMENIGSGNGFKKILNVFNGIGYIGCSTFVLPGVKGLAPNGRNADRTYKNTEITFSSVELHHIGYANNSRLCFLDNRGLLSYGVYNYFESDTLPDFSGTYATWYDTLHNLVFDTADGGATWTQRARIYMGALYKVANNVITNINVKDEFKAVDYSNKHAITDLLMPDYTAGIEVQNATATSGSYTAPSNGQFVLDILAGTNTTTFKINNIAVAQQKATTGGSYNATYNVFVKYGDSITWTSSGSANMKAYFYPMTRI